MDKPADDRAAIIDQEIAQLEALHDAAEAQRTKLVVRIAELQAAIAELRRTKEWGG